MLPTHCYAKTESVCAGLVKQYAATIRRFALRLAAKREVILDEAEAAIKQAHEEVTQRAVLDNAWQKIARAQAELSVRKYKEQELRKAAPKSAGSSESRLQYTGRYTCVEQADGS